MSEVKITTKTCIKCGFEKPVSEFCRNKNSKDGCYYCCKKCVQKKVFPNYLKSKKKKAEKDIVLAGGEYYIVRSVGDIKDIFEW